jgi:hypothetical protein
MLYKYIYSYASKRRKIYTEENSHMRLLQYSKRLLGYVEEGGGCLYFVEYLLKEIGKYKLEKLLTYMEV